MKFLFDENMTLGLVGNLSSVAPWHEFSHVTEVGLRGTEDVDLLPQVSELGFDAIITDDRRQLGRLDEKTAIVNSGLHWITLRRTNIEGFHGIAAETASLTAAFPHIVEALDRSDSQLKIVVTGIQRERTQRIKVFPL